MNVGKKVDIIVDMIANEGGLELINMDRLKWSICDKFSCSSRTGAELRNIALARYERLKSEGVPSPQG